MIGDFPSRPDWSCEALDAYDGLLLYRGVTFDEAAVRAAGGLAYLASPYTRLSVDEHGQWSVPHSMWAQEAATAWAIRFARAGVTAVSPVVMAGAMVLQDYVRDEGPDLDPLDRAFWAHWCLPLLAVSASVVIPPIPGWGHSLGVWREAVAALGGNRPVFLIGEGA